ncbi:hypothetical protein J3S89_13445 [Pinisolibacter sp. B13]|nr:hypothetical protein [Pinisolibacter aquiterrae]
MAHPLDVGYGNNRRNIRLTIHRFGLEGRVDFLQSGPLVPIVQKALGLVTINSTADLAALRNHIPFSPSATPSTRSKVPPAGPRPRTNSAPSGRLRLRSLLASPNASSPTSSPRRRCSAASICRRLGPTSPLMSSDD